MMTHFIYDMTMTSAKLRLEYELTKDTPYLTLTDELWGILCAYFGDSTIVYMYDLKWKPKVIIQFGSGRITQPTTLGFIPLRYV